MHYGLLYDGFLLGIAGAAAILFVLLWWWRSDSRHLALAFLSVGASFFALVPDPLLTLNLICILLALALPFYYPSLFYFRGQPGASRLVGLSNAIFLVAHLSLAVIALAIDVVGGVPSEMMRALGAWFYIPLLLVPPAITLMAAAARERRLLFFIWVTALVVVSGYDIRAMAQKEDPAGVVFALVGLMLLVQLGHHIRRQFAAADESYARHAELRGEMEQRAAELKGLMVKAQAAGVAKTQFVSAVSHELRTPLTAIQGYTHILREEIDPQPGSVIDEFLGTIKDSCNRLILLVNDLLDMARVESGRLVVSVDEVPLRPVLVEVVAQLYPLASAKNVMLLRPHLAAEDAVVHADPLRLRQVLINLLSNAVKFTERGCIGINVYPTAMNAYARTPYNEGGYAIQVFDTGVGISSEFLEKVFEPFTQEERSYCNTQRGTGLGLSITRELVQRMGGTISVESQLDQGSIFTVYLAAGAGTGRTIAQAA